MHGPKEGPGMRIRGQKDIEISISDGGYICLKQKSEQEGEQVIEFAPSFGTKVASGMGTLQGFAQAKFLKASPDEDGAPRRFSSRAGTRQPARRVSASFQVAGHGLRTHAS